MRKQVGSLDALVVGGCHVLVHAATRWHVHDRHSTPVNTSILFCIFMHTRRGMFSSSQPPFLLNLYTTPHGPLTTLNPQPSTLNPQPSTLNPQPSTLNQPCS